MFVMFMEYNSRTSSSLFKSTVRFLFDSQVAKSVKIKDNEVVFDAVYMRCVLIVDNCLKKCKSLVL